MGQNHRWPSIASSEHQAGFAAKVGYHLLIIAVANQPVQDDYGVCQSLGGRDESRCSTTGFLGLRWKKGTCKMIAIGTLTASGAH